MGDVENFFDYVIKNQTKITYKKNQIKEGNINSSWSLNLLLEIDQCVKLNHGAHISRALLSSHDEIIEIVLGMKDRSNDETIDRLLGVVDEALTNEGFNIISNPIFLEVTDIVIFFVNKSVNHLIDCGQKSVSIISPWKVNDKVLEYTYKLALLEIEINKNSKLF